MDLKLIPNAEATPSERSALDGVLGEPTDGWDGGRRLVGAPGNVAFGGHAARGRRHLLLPALWALQSRIGWISPGGINEICRRLTIPPADAYGVASFYALLSTEPRPSRVVHVCEDLACRCNGSEELIATLEERFGEEGELSADGGGTWFRSPCLGQCDAAPAAFLSVSGENHDEVVLTSANADELLALIDADEPAASAIAADAVPQAGEPDLKLLRRIATASTLDLYRAQGGYEALSRALELGPEGVIGEVKESRLVGRGGAAFPTGVKWEAVAKHPTRPHYLVCNADESEPGTFKDRVLIGGDPFALVEAMTIAGFAVGAEESFVYIRGEYPDAERRLQAAIDEARDHGLLGENILGAGFRFDIEIRKGAGAYICGEETAIFNSIEGQRGEPRSKPPFPVDEGLFGRPTVINNVETLVNVLEIVLEGGAAYAATGTEGSTGTKLFCVSGNARHPGVYEVPFGTTLGTLLSLAGGVADDRPLQAVLMGGAAGGFVTPAELDLELSIEGARAADTTLGSGVVMVLDDTVDIPAFLQRIAAFFRDESCGQCVPCRVGTVRQEEALSRLVAGNTRGEVVHELQLVQEVGQCMRDASICGLGQTASSAIESAIGRLGLFQEAPS